jgi:predicted DCC family thiol-disulfide oxidoreductase YuxK
MPADRPLLIYDRDCEFCRHWIVRWRRLTRDRVACAPYQDVADRFPEIPRQRFQEAVHLIDADGRWSRGAEAVFRSLALAGQGSWLWTYRHVPGMRALSEWGYRLVARNRPLLSRLGRPGARRD